MNRNFMDTLLHHATSYLTGSPSAVGAVLANHPYPARDLLLTLTVFAFIAWVVMKVAKAVQKK